MANTFKTTLKKEIIADIANNNKREVRFPITKFWATRFADEFNLDDKTFVFKTFDTLEFSSPSNKDTDANTYVFSFTKTYVDGDEFVVEFKDLIGENEINTDDVDVITEEIFETEENNEETVDNSNDENVFIDEAIVDDTDMEDVFIDEEFVKSLDDNNISTEKILDFLTQNLENDGVLEKFYESDSVIATNAKQVIILPKGKILGFKKSLPVNNDVEVRIEFDMSDKLYFDDIIDFQTFENAIINILEDIRKNNFVFIWKRHTGIFTDSNGRIYFGIKYSTRKSIGFNRKYNVQ